MVHYILHYMKNNYRRERKQVSFVVDVELWETVKRSAAGVGLSVTAFVTALLEEAVNASSGVGQGSGTGVGSEGVGAELVGGRVGDRDSERGVDRRRGVEHVPGWAVDVLSTRRGVTVGVGDAEVEPDPLTEIA